MFMRAGGHQIDPAALAFASQNLQLLLVDSPPEKAVEAIELEETGTLPPFAV